MAICDKISSGRSQRGCRKSTPGVYTFYIASYPDNIINPFDWDGATGTGFAQLNISGNTVTDFDELKIQFYEFKPEKGSGSFTETSSTEPANGSTSFEQKVTFNLAGLSAEMRDQVQILVQGDAVLVAKDRNNNYVMFGAYDGIHISTSTSQSGVGGTDLSGYALEFTAEEGDTMFFVDEAAIIAAVVS